VLNISVNINEKKFNIIEDFFNNNNKENREVKRFNFDMRV